MLNNMEITIDDVLLVHEAISNVGAISDLHRHFDGSVRPSTLWEMSEAYYKAMPWLTDNEFKKYLTHHDGENLLAYLDKFNLPLQYTQFYDTIQRCTYEICEDAVNEKISHLEIRINPIIHRRAGLSTRQVINAVRAGIAEAESKFLDFTANIIIIAIRNHGGNIAKILIKEIAGSLASLDVTNGVVGFDIAGAENGFPPILFKEAYQFASRLQLGLTVHAGEAAGPEYIWQAIDELGAHRIGHGVAAALDIQLMVALSSRQIPLEICITSNLDTGSVQSLLRHPVIQFIEHNIPVVICTDNPTVSDTSLIREFCILQKIMNLSISDLERIIANSNKYCFKQYRGDQQ